MGKISQGLKEKYERLKQMIDRLTPGSAPKPQLVLQPVRPKKYEKGQYPR